jgi:hypothetical protein
LPWICLRLDTKPEPLLKSISVRQSQERFCRDRRRTCCRLHILCVTIFTSAGKQNSRSGMKSQYAPLCYLYSRTVFSSRCTACREAKRLQNAHVNSKHRLLLHISLDCRAQFARVTPHTNSRALHTVIHTERSTEAGKSKSKAIPITDHGDV